ncbi:MAG: SusD/RagB family nutrient-binding outer membrane lipoprotein [Bacteroidetes bacterium]|nr:SusD/RagB family nutrient-binding outer membrane lipoprotein [Bacteroidota bacterium]
MLAGMWLLEGCTKKFESYNTDPFGISTQDLSADYRLLGEPLKQVQLNIYVSQPAWNTQLQQNLMGDMFSGYMTPPTPFGGTIVNNETYALNDGWNTFPWDDAYGSVMSNVKAVIQSAGSTYPAYVAWARILKVEAMHRVSDIYGPIIYSKYGVVNKDGSISYDSQKDVYYAFFSDLDSAVNVLTPMAQSGAAPTFASFDLVYGGSYKQWVKFANTLRLRLAIRLAKADPAKAKTEGEKALAHPLGLLKDVADVFNINFGATTHPLNVINGSWGDIRMGAPMESYLKGYNDPRMAKYFVPASDPVVSGQYKGIRNGVNIDSKDRYVGYSALVTFPNMVQLMTPAEAWFLKAEAALRGWTGAGSIQTNYENGIKASFAQYGLDATSYIADATSKPQPYTDPKAITAGQNDIIAGSPYLGTLTIKWDPAATSDQQLERIITQKWLAMYPDGQEAWTEFRRTGYPKLFPVVINNSGGTISTTAFIRRINFASSEKNTNPLGVAQAVSLLGGPDNGGTRLWWDKP